MCSFHIYIADFLIEFQDLAIHWKWQIESNTPPYVIHKWTTFCESTQPWKHIYSLWSMKKMRQSVWTRSSQPSGRAPSSSSGASVLRWGSNIRHDPVDSFWLGIGLARPKGYWGESGIKIIFLSPSLLQYDYYIYIKKKYLPK